MHVRTQLNFVCTYNAHAHMYNIIPIDPLPCGDISRAAEYLEVHKTSRNYSTHRMFNAYVRACVFSRVCVHMSVCIISMCVVHVAS